MLDSIVQINITTQSLAMAQKGFGVPLIMGEHDCFSERVKTFKDLSELPVEVKNKDGKLIKNGFNSESKIYGMAMAILSQNPQVQQFKIGRWVKGEKILDAFNAICNEDSDFYGLLLAHNNAETYVADVQILAQEVATKRILLGLDLEMEETEKSLELAQQLMAKEFKNIFSIYKIKPKELKYADYPAAAWMGKMLPKAPGSATWAFQQLTGVSKAMLSASFDDKLKKTRVNRYVNIKDVGVTLDGKTASGQYIDIICAIDWLYARLQERLFRLLVVNQKIPYTLKGIDLVRSEIIAQLKEAVYQGVLAAEPEPQVSTPTIDEISSDERGRRVLPKVRFSGRLQGAIHEIHIEGTVAP